MNKKLNKTKIEKSSKRPNPKKSFKKEIDSEKKVQEKVKNPSKIIIHKDDLSDIILDNEKAFQPSSFFIRKSSSLEARENISPTMTSPELTSQTDDNTDNMFSYSQGFKVNYDNMEESSNAFDFRSLKKDFGSEVNMDIFTKESMSGYSTTTEKVDYYKSTAYSSAGSAEELKKTRRPFDRREFT